MNDGSAALLLVALLVAAYVLPTLIALSRRHQNGLAIGILNAVLGWTVVGWIGALVWALTAVTHRSSPARSGNSSGKRARRTSLGNHRMCKVKTKCPGA